MKYPEDTLSIKSWAEEDRPREKLLKLGRKNLTNAELLAIILGSGTKDESALGLAQRLLGASGNNLNDLGRMRLEELKTFRGIGMARAVSIIAAFELGRRRRLTDIRERPQVKCSADAYNAIASLLLDLPQEEFWILLLNRANRVVGRERISSGGLSATIVDARVIFQKAISGLACSIILCHNHPSGNTKPSQADIDITRKLKKGGEALDITVLDHLIIAETGYYSFADEGLM
jgi:DNA repair protein RadC